MIVMIALFKSFLVELVCFRFYLKSFFLDGHGTKYKKCMGTQTPRFFPLMGTVPSTKYCWAPGSCPSVKILSKSVGHGSLGASWQAFRPSESQVAYQKKYAPNHHPLTKA